MCEVLEQTVLQTPRFSTEVKELQTVWRARGIMGGQHLAQAAKCIDLKETNAENKCAFDCREVLRLPLSSRMNGSGCVEKHFISRTHD